MSVSVEITATEPAWTMPTDDDWPGWLLTPGEFAETAKKIDKINSRAVRRGFTGRVELDAADEIVTRTVNGLTVEERMIRVKIVGQAPAYGGWRFLARLVWDPYSGLLVNVAPGISAALVDRDALEEGRCDHCNINRNRSKIMLVEHVETGERKQVGSTCLKDFLGWRGAPVFFDAGEIREGVDDMLGDYAGGGGERSWSVQTVLAAAWASCRARGFRPSSAAGATRDHVAKILNPRTADRETLEDVAPLLAESAGQARLIRQWILDQPAGGSEFMQNLRAAAAGDWAGPRVLGLLASAPSVWAEAVDRELRQAQQAEQSGLVNEHFGQVGDRCEVRVRVESIRHAYHAYGVSTVYKLVGEAGHVFAWFASRPVLGDDTVETEGKWFTIKATIKGHGEFRGALETQLTRCKLVD